MLDFLETLPIATPVQRVERQPGVFVDGAYTPTGIVSRLHGPNVSTESYEIGVSGRGSLIVDAVSFDAMLSTMIMVRAMAEMPSDATGA